MSTPGIFATNAARVAFKEARESLYAVRGAMWAVLSAVTLSLMSYLLLTDQELSLLDQSEMLYIVASLSVGLGMLSLNSFSETGNPLLSYLTETCFKRMIQSYV